MLEKILKTIMAISCLNGIIWAMALDSANDAGFIAGVISLISMLICIVAGLIWRKLYE